ncbi:hypothetical protein EIP86_002285 [Pleurotus ostreatoroseus]|nr:hypothetical protein EIP86_002285 [Pleurotus ostreatoroseus]
MASSTVPGSVVGVEAALQTPQDVSPSPTLFARDFSLKGRVAIVTGAYGGLGLESALALVEAGARVVYCIGRAATPPEKWVKLRDYVARMAGKGVEGRLEYVSADVTDREKVLKVAEEIGNKEGRLDVCVASHGVGPTPVGCLDCSPDVLQKALDVNINGALYVAQAAGKQMIRFGNGGSIILISSMAGSITLRHVPSLAYNTSKAAVLQMARSMACELGQNKIRVNSISPGYMYTGMTSDFLDAEPARWASGNPLGRTGQPQEMRGVVTWLASDASSYCTGSDITLDGGHSAW